MEKFLKISLISLLTLNCEIFAMNKSELSKPDTYHYQKTQLLSGHEETNDDSETSKSESRSVSTATSSNTSFKSESSSDSSIKSDESLSSPKKTHKKRHRKNRCTVKNPVFTQINHILILHAPHDTIYQEDFLKEDDADSDYYFNQYDEEYKIPQNILKKLNMNKRKQERKYQKIF